jgi:DNA repair exonuclease SbcCD nuclease subunit
VSPARLQARYGSAANRDEVNAHVAELLVNVAQGLLEDCRRVGTDLPAVLLTHFAISGASLPTGLPVDMLREPVLPLGELEALGFGAIVASHIHKPQLLTSELGGGPAFFTGSPMAHDFGGADFDHGVWLLEFADGGTRVSFEPVESRPLVTLDFDHEDAVAQIALSASLGWDIPDGALLRVRYAATAEQQRRIDIPLLRRQLLEAGAHAVNIEPQIIRADRARVEGLDDSLSELDALAEWVRVNEIDELLAGLMREKTVDYLAGVA